MPGPDWFLILAPLLALSLPASGGLLAYVGLGPGQEFIPLFLSLLFMVGGMLIAVLLWPVTALRRFLRARRARLEKPADPPAPCLEAQEHVQEHVAVPQQKSADPPAPQEMPR